MTVRCIKQVDKAYIAQTFATKTQTVAELAMTFGRSRRTIVRVLEDECVNPCLRIRKIKPKTVDIQLPFTQPGPIEMFDASVPWYLRIAHKVVEVSRRVGIHV